MNSRIVTSTQVMSLVENEKKVTFRLRIRVKIVIYNAEHVKHAALKPIIAL